MNNAEFNHCWSYSGDKCLGQTYKYLSENMIAQNFNLTSVTTVVISSTNWHRQI